MHSHYRCSPSVFIDKLINSFASQTFKATCKCQKLTSIIYCKGKEKASGARAPVPRNPIDRYGWIRRLNAMDDFQTTHSFIRSLDIYGLSTSCQKMLNTTGSLTLRSSFNQRLQNYKQKSQQF